MRGLALTVGLACAGIAWPQAGEKKEPPAVERLCGTLEHAEYVPIKGQANSFERKSSNLPKVALRLYEAAGDRPCCETLRLVSETRSNHWGNFRLEKNGLPPGLYWIVASPASREYRLLVRYAPAKGSTDLCKDYCFEVNNEGEFSIGKTIVVD